MSAELELVLLVPPAAVCFSCSLDEAVAVLRGKATQGTKADLVERLAETRPGYRAPGTDRAQLD